jgi:hypothetical protein
MRILWEKLGAKLALTGKKNTGFRDFPTFQRDLIDNNKSKA